MTIAFVALGLDHRHIYGMTQFMLETGARCLGYWTEGAPGTLEGYVKRFPDVPRIETLDKALALGADLALVSAIPADRATLAIRAMDGGLDVMSDKPG